MFVCQRVSQIHTTAENRMSDAEPQALTDGWHEHIHFHKPKICALWLGTQTAELGTGGAPLDTIETIGKWWFSKETGGV